MGDVKSKTKTRKVIGIEIEMGRVHNCFDVRVGPSTIEELTRADNRALNFAEKIEAGAVFPLPIVTRVADFPGGMFSEKPKDDYIIVDGRTRYRAMEALSRKTITCEVQIFPTVWQVEAFAFRANYGGPEPMTALEEKRIVKQLSEAGIKPKQIADSTGIPVGRVDVYISGARATRLQLKMKEALKAVRQTGMTAQIAAQKFDVDQARIEKAMRKLISLPGLKGQVTTAAKKYINTVRTVCSSAFDAFGEDMVTAEHLYELLNHLDKLGMDIQRANTERRRAAEKVIKAEKGTTVIV